MNTRILSFVVLSSLLTIWACAPKSQVNYPFKFIDSKTEMLGENNNRMDLYIPKGRLAIDSLRMLCVEQKDVWDGAFYFLVVFDDQIYATFPSNPRTALYADEVRMKHILAVYKYNKTNGYSELFFYPVNMFESPPIKIGV